MTKKELEIKTRSAIKQEKDMEDLKKNLNSMKEALRSMAKQRVDVTKAFEGYTLWSQDLAKKTLKDCGFEEVLKEQFPV